MDTNDLRILDITKKAEQAKSASREERLNILAELEAIVKDESNPKNIQWAAAANYQMVAEMIINDR